MPSLTSFIQQSFGSLRHTNQRRKVKDPNWKRRSETHFFADDVILYIEYAKNVTGKQLDFISELGKVAGYNLVYFCTLTT